MAESGFEVLLVSSPGPRLAEFAATEGLPVASVPMTRSITPIDDLRSVWRLMRLFRQHRPDIVHAHTPKAGLLAIIAATVARVPVRIYHLHGLRATTATGLRRKILLLTEWITCRLATQVLSVSASLQSLVVQRGLCPSDKIATPLHGTINGVDAVQRFNPARQPGGTRELVRRRLRIPADATVLGFVGRIARDKGWMELAEAWRSLRQEFKQLRLLVVGPVETHDPVPADVLQLLKTDPRIHWIGEQWDTPPLYMAMDLVVLPTYREGFPTVLLEAAAMERPCVATRAIGCVDAVQHDVTGILLPIGDTSALKAALARYTADSDLCRRHGAAARTRVLASFQQEPMWQAIHQQYSRLLANAAVGLPQASAARRAAA